MKKLITFLMMTLLILSVIGCTAPQQTETQTTDATQQPQATEAAAQESTEPINLVIDSWRTDDISAWQDFVIPAYEATHPNVKITFDAISNSEYTTVLSTKLQGGAAGDIIMCEPYDSRISLYQDGYLVKLNDLPGLDADTDHYDEFALSAWSTDDGDLYAIPLAAVSHGFMYNKTMFDSLGLTAPKTVDEFFQVCKAIKDAGYTALALGSSEEWIGNVYAYSIVCPTFTKGEEGRLGLINGTAKFTDPGFVQAFQFIQDWIPYLPDGYQTLNYSDMCTLFATQQTLMMPCGSWDISVMKNLVGDQFEYSAFQVPDAGYGQYVCFHPDNGLALNAASPNQEAAIEFLQWTTTEDFAKIWNAALPGFFTLSKHSVQLDNPLANEMLSWATTADGASPRVAYQYLSRNFNTDNEIARVTTLMLLGEMDAQTAANTLQTNFAAGYTPKG